MRQSPVRVLRWPVAAAAAVALSLTLAAGGAPAQPAPEGLRPGAPYDVLRRSLQASGWRPVPRPGGEHGCVEGDRRCERFLEAWACSGTGAAFCRFQWRGTDGEELMVITAGGDGRSGEPGTVSHWDDGGASPH
ncbi:hypothetical protein EVJ50_01065 [Synechococcus sp. RSCCF101]|uniref:hypothetical protein n=1 Tax=Synechococcus sp. RSCCF101 TaxID=2511069 RepID=UPI001245557C|nr:hypothetical protein [Synechococcus sp. RSCCF101]QEY31049.1 hypothetical protein EVJ50_01065 [Synechococcus sp. RSCCF101]